MIFKPSIVGLLGFDPNTGYLEVQQTIRQDIYLNSDRVLSIESFGVPTHPEINSILKYEGQTFGCKESAKGLVALINFGHTEVGKLLYAAEEG